MGSVLFDISQLKIQASAGWARSADLCKQWEDRHPQSMLLLSQKSPKQAGLWTGRTWLASTVPSFQRGKIGWWESSPPGTPGHFYSVLGIMWTVQKIVKHRWLFKVPNQVKLWWFTSKPSLTDKNKRNLCLDRAVFFVSLLSALGERKGLGTEQ